MVAAGVNRSALATVGNVIGFQIVWVAAVAGAARGWWWAGPLALALFAAWQLAVSARRLVDLQLLLLSIPLGLLIDTAWVQLGWISFAASVPSDSVAPVWIIAMWMGFALTLNHSLAALQTRKWLGALLGLVGGPLAYYAAAKAWGAAEIVDSWMPYAALGIAWAVVTPLLLRAAELLAAPRSTTSLRRA